MEKTKEICSEHTKDRARLKRENLAHLLLGRTPGNNNNSGGGGGGGLASGKHDGNGGGAASNRNTLMPTSATLQLPTANSEMLAGTFNRLAPHATVFGDATRSLAPPLLDQTRLADGAAQTQVCPACRQSIATVGGNLFAHVARCDATQLRKLAAQTRKRKARAREAPSASLPLDSARRKTRQRVLALQNDLQELFGDVHAPAAGAQTARQETAACVERLRQLLA